MDASSFSKLLQDAFGSSGSTSEEKDLFPVPVFVSIYPGYTSMGNIKNISMMLWDMGERPVYAIQELSRPIDTRKYPGDGKGPADEFFVKHDTRALTIFTQKLGLMDGYRLVFVFGKRGGDYNHVASLLNDTDPMYGGIYLCLQDSKGNVQGIRSKELVRFVLRGLDSATNHTCYSWVADDSGAKPTAEKLRKRHDEALADMLEEIENGKIHSAL